MDKEQILAELTLADISTTLRDHIIADYKADADAEKKITELTTARDAEKKLVKELQTKLAERDAAQFLTVLDKQIAETVDWKVEGDDAEKRVEIVRGALRMHVLSEMGDDRDVSKVKELVEMAWKSDDIKLLAETVKAALGGPRAIVGGKRRDVSKLEDTPEARRRARQQTGI